MRPDVPMGASYQEIEESAFRQAYQPGSAERAVAALGACPALAGSAGRRS